MRSLYLLISLLLCFVCSGVCNAWEINFNFSIEDIKNRNVAKVLIGGVASVAVHETGHFIAGRALGMNTKYTWASGPAVYADNFYSKSETDRAIFAVAGMLSQAVVGTVLTKYANGSDYTLGFNSVAAVANMSYPLRGGDLADWSNMPHGKLITFGHGLYSTGLTLINLDIVH